MKPGSIEWEDVKEIAGELRCIYNKLLELRDAHMIRFNNGRARQDSPATACLLRSLEYCEACMNVLSEAARLEKEGV
ncbi:MAG: hypothetical protein LBK25_08225 [Treponema sp.]|jgi:hypothetical protein|nr:hypothetical protein [Treponema sp.]